MIEFLALLMSVAPEARMTEEGQRSLELEVDQTGDRLEVRLLTLPGKAQRISYSLEVVGSSTSRHKGSTTITGDSAQVLSTIRASAGENWCVRASVQEENGASYELVQGPCEG